MLATANGPRLSTVVSVSGSVGECIPTYIDPDLQLGDLVEVFGEIISMNDSVWACEGDYYVRKVTPGP